MSEPRGNEPELAYQRERAARLGHMAATPVYIMERYRRSSLWRLFPKERLFHMLGDLHGKTVLDFACGEGQVSTQLAYVGAKVTGIDISPDLIEMAARRATLDGVADRTRFLVCDILEGPLPGEFDYVVCSAALHHVDLYAVAPRLLACLKPGGTIFVMEPIAFSPGLQRVRDRLPVGKDASPDERQLTRAEIDFLCRTFAGCRVEYFNLLGRLVRFFPNANRIDKGHPFTKAAIAGLLGADRLLASFGFLRKFYGQVFLSGTRPTG